jgi:ABC-2 type transport system permease protein
MWSIAKRELRFFFSSPIGYLVIGTYLIVNSLLLWFFDTPFSILNSGFGDFTPFFEISPWLFLILIPTLCMRSFSEEIASGTFELMLTKPLAAWEIYAGKLLGIVIVFGIALIPTSINLFAIQSLLAPDSFIDFGSVIGSYFGLIFVGLLFMGISLMSSLLFQNQVVSFLVAVLGCFSQFYLWFFIADFTTNNALFKFINEIGIYAHYLNMSRGVITFKTTLYFMGFLTGYFLLGVQQVENKGGLIKVIKMPLVIFTGTLLAVYLSNAAPFQLDLTGDKRYSLSQSTISKIQTLDEPIRLDVFLSGELPGPYLRFRNELDTFLNQLQRYSNQFIISYNDPFEIGTNKQVITEMQRYGMTPEIVVENKEGKRNENLIFPWIIVNRGERSERVSLLQKQLGDTENDKLVRSLQQLEYHIMDGIYKITLQEKQNLAVLTSHETSEDIKIADLLQSLSPYYNLAAFDLKQSKVSPQQSLKNLTRFDALFISNPKTAFTQTEKYILDQHALSGGKQFWLVDGLGLDRDSLFNIKGKTYGFPRELNLEDYFFNFGIRLRKELIKDLYSAPIVLANGSEENSQYVPYPWPYYPLSKPESDNSIGNDLGPVLTQFVSPIDTLPNALKKTILLQSSGYTQTIPVPAIVDLEQVVEKIQPSQFDEPAKILGVKVQGDQTSLFSNRIKPISLENNLEKGTLDLILFGDGNFAENQIDKGQPLSLGYDKWTNNFYSNKDLIMNGIYYLTANAERLSLRKKTWNVAFLAEEKIIENASFWKACMLLFPLLLGLGIGLVNQLMRSKQLRV